MPQRRHTARARADLLDIWLTIAAENPTAADRLFDRLEERTQILTDRVAASGCRLPDHRPRCANAGRAALSDPLSHRPRWRADHAGAARRARHWERSVHRRDGVIQLIPLSSAVLPAPALGVRDAMAKGRHPPLDILAAPLSSSSRHSQRYTIRPFFASLIRPKEVCLCSGSSLRRRPLPALPEALDRLGASDGSRNGPARYPSARARSGP